VTQICRSTIIFVFFMRSISICRMRLANIKQLNKRTIHFLQPIVVITSCIIVEAADHSLVVSSERNCFDSSVNNSTLSSIQTHYFPVSNILVMLNMRTSLLRTLKRYLIIFFIVIGLTLMRLNNQNSKSV
jgi:hypothetical protein